LHAAFDAVVVVVVVVVMNGYVECCWEEWTTLCHIDYFQA
jgi:hypothetical protein